MNTGTATLVIVALFVLRLGIPVAGIVLLTWGLRRLDRRWQAEAEAERRQALAVEPAAALAAGPAEPVCWEVKQCPPERRDACPAFLAPALPCWLARRDAEGCLPDGCFACALFKRIKPTSAPQPITGD